MPQKSKTEEKGMSSKEFEEFGHDSKLGSDFSLIAIMIALILFCISSFLGYRHLDKLLNSNSVTPSIPNSVVIYDKE